MKPVFEDLCPKPRLVMDPHRVPTMLTPGTGTLQGYGVEYIKMRASFPHSGGAFLEASKLDGDVTSKFKAFGLSAAEALV